MKKIAALIVCLFAGGCDYTTPLVKTPEMDIATNVIGLWERPAKDGQTESLLALPLGKREYLVSYPSGSKDAMFARACLCAAADKTLVQLEWIGTARGGLADDGKVYQFAGYSVTGDTLVVRLMNADVVKRDAKSPEDLAKSIRDNKDKPDFFRNDMVFTKAKK